MRFSTLSFYKSTHAIAFVALEALGVEEFYLEYTTDYMVICATGWPEHVPVVTVLLPDHFQSYFCSCPSVVVVNTHQFAGLLKGVVDNAECILQVEAGGNSVVIVSDDCCKSCVAPHIYK